MSFNENDVNRDKSGKFDTKTGSAADISLPARSVANVQGLADALKQRAEQVDVQDQPLPDISDFNPHAETPLPDISDFDPHTTSAQKNIRSVAELLQTEALDEEGVTLDDIAKLRAGMERAEFRLTEYEIEEYLDANYPEVKGILVESDGYEYPRFVGAELEDDDAPLGQNWQKAVPLDGKYNDLRNYLNGKYNAALNDFQDRGSFDEFATVMYDDNDEYGRFTGLESYVSSPDTPVYRIAERS